MIVVSSWTVILIACYNVTRDVKINHLCMVRLSDPKDCTLKLLVPLVKQVIYFVTSHRTISKPYVTVIPQLASIFGPKREEHGARKICIMKCYNLNYYQILE